MKLTGLFGVKFPWVKRREAREAAAAAKLAREKEFERRWASYGWPDPRKQSPGASRPVASAVGSDGVVHHMPTVGDSDPFDQAYRSMSMSGHGGTFDGGGASGDWGGSSSSCSSSGSSDSGSNSSSSDSGSCGSGD